MKVEWDVPNRAVKIDDKTYQWAAIEKADFVTWQYNLDRTVAIYLRMKGLVEKFEAGLWPTYVNGAAILGLLMDENNISARAVLEESSRCLERFSPTLLVPADEIIDFAKDFSEAVGGA